MLMTEQIKRLFPGYRLHAVSGRLRHEGAPPPL